VKVKNVRKDIIQVLSHLGTKEEEYEEIMPLIVAPMVA
jgi:hypothetical protein